MSAPKHKYSKMLETKVRENLVVIQEPVEAENTEWYNVYEDGDLKVCVLLYLCDTVAIFGFSMQPGFLYNAKLIFRRLLDPMNYDLKMFLMLFFERSTARMLK